MTDTTHGVTDEFMQEMLGKSKTYALIILRPGPNYGDATKAEATIWEHGRRNFALRADGVMPLVGPITDDTDTCGIAILNVPVDDAGGIMDADPAVSSGIFTYEVHPFRSFPGDALPA